MLHQEMVIGAIYIRVSTDKQTELSPDSQLKEAKEYARRHNIFIPPEHIYIDEGRSGRSVKNRAAFQRMISNAKSKPTPFRVILLWKFSRFARNQEESIVYKALLKKECGISVVSISEDIPDDIYGSLIERNIEWFDEFYSIQLSQEVTTKMTFAAEQGKFMTSPPFGFNKVPLQDVLQINDHEAYWYAQARQLCLQGASLLSIARKFNENHVYTKRGNKFDSRGIEYILRNPIQIGCVRWTPEGRPSQNRVYDDPNTIVRKSDQVPRLCSDEEFHAVQDELNRRKASRKKYSKPADLRKHWLSGIVQCGSCGGNLTYSPTHGGFQCWRYAKGLCDTSHFINGKKLEAAVLSALESVTVTDQFVKDNTPPPAAAQDDVVDYGRRIDKLTSMLDRAKVAYVEGIDTLEEYSENKKRISEEIERLKNLQQEAAVVQEIPAKEEVEEKLTDIISLLRGDNDKDVKAAAISSIVDHMVFDRAKNTLKVFFRL